MRVVAPPTPRPPIDEVVRASDTAPGDSAAAEWSPWPETLLSEQEIIGRVRALPALSEPRRQEAARGVRTVLTFLRRAEGSSWQERWHSGCWDQAPDLATVFGDSVRVSAFKSGEIMHG